MRINKSKIESLRMDNGKLQAYAWPGGYPIFYIDTAGLVLCPDCANKESEYSDPIAEADINYEDTDLYCEDCNNRIESAYGED